MNQSAGTKGLCVGARALRPADSAKARRRNARCVTISSISP